MLFYSVKNTFQLVNEWNVFGNKNVSSQCFKKCEGRNLHRKYVNNVRVWRPSFEGLRTKSTVITVRITGLVKKKKKETWCPEKDKQSSKRQYRPESSDKYTFLLFSVHMRMQHAAHKKALSYCCLDIDPETTKSIFYLSKKLFNNINL